MNQIPVPLNLAEHLRSTPADYYQGNPSLFFDRAFAGYTPEWDGFQKEDSETKTKEGKKEFLDHFVQMYAQNPACQTKTLDKLTRRRQSTFQSLNIKPLYWKNETRLVLGLGLPHPTETGFLFDRLTGLPYLPGSSLKGLARAAAVAVQRGELEVPLERKEYWEKNFDRLFGPSDTATASRKGELLFHDSFPTTPPSLVVDILNPHYTSHFDDLTKPPADWHNPIPVYFLAIEPGCTFQLFVGFRSLKEGYRLSDTVETRQQINALLGLAFDYLGAGAKTSSGYGFLQRSSAPQSGRKGRSPERVQLGINGTTILAYRGSSSTFHASAAKRTIAGFALLGKLSKDQKRLLKKHKLGAEVVITGRRIEKIVSVDS